LFVPASSCGGSMSVRPSPISGTTVVPPSKFALNWALLSPPE